MEKELDSTLGRLSAEHTFLRAKAGLQLLLLSHAQAMNTEEDLFLPTALLDIKAEVRTLLSSLETTLGTDAAATVRKQCEALKANTLELYQKVYCYFAALGIITEPINDQMALRRYREEHLGDKQLDFSGFLQDCTTLLEHAESHSELLQLQGALLKCAPLRMTRDKFFDLISAAMDTAFAEESEESIRAMLKTLRRAVCPELEEGFDTLYPEAAAWIAEKRQLKFAPLSDNELDEILSDLQGLWQSLARISDGLEELYADVNTLLLLNTLPFTYDELTAEDLTTTDTYHALCEIFDGDVDALEAEALGEQLAERIEAELSPLLDAANATGAKVKAELEKASDLQDLSEDTAKALMTESFVISTFYADAAEDMFSREDTGTPAVEDAKKALCAAFLSEVRSYFAAQPSDVRKPAMQVLLTALPVPMQPAEVIVYLEQALEQSVTVEDKFLIVDKAGAILDEHGFYHDESEENEEGEGLCSCGGHHDHDHECICGHHHDHHHDCGCGHHH